MAEVLVLHHVLGRTKGIEAIADQLRDAGHTVHVPDLFDGRIFSSLEEGSVFVKEIGFEEVTARGVRAASELSRDVVYAGFSLGVPAAQQLAQTRKGARGALFFHACLPTSAFESQWPATCLCKFTPCVQILFSLKMATSTRPMSLWRRPITLNFFCTKAGNIFSPTAVYRLTMLTRRNL